MQWIGSGKDLMLGGGRKRFKRCVFFGGGGLPVRGGGGLANARGGARLCEGGVGGLCLFALPFGLMPFGPYAFWPLCLLVPLP